MHTTFTFDVKQVRGRLFGLIDAPDQAPWRSLFAAQAPLTSVRIDGAAIALIASDLGKDARIYMLAADTYVTGSQLPGTEGLSGTLLGDLGEMLTFLVYRANGHNIARVVTAVRGKKTLKGDRFPTPDFIIDDNGTLAALEVKSTEAFNFVKLDGTSKKWTWLQPCAAVKRCRKDALPQLAYVGNAVVAPKHNLKTHHKRTVGFPVSKGIVAAVLAVDGRTMSLRANTKYRTPGFCRPSNDCWKCMPAACDFAMVHMPNSPGMLALPGSPRDGSADWLLAYKRWTQALYARNRIALESSLSDLTKLLGAWLGGMEAQEPDSLRKFWRQYLRIAMRTRGIALPVPSLGPGDNMEDADDGVRPEPIRTPVVREQSFAAIAAFTRDPDSAEDAAVCMEYKPNGRSVGSVTVRRRGSELEFELFSTVWEEKGRVETSGQAAELIAQLALFAIRATGRGALPQSWDEFLQRELPLREAAALVGDRRLFFGWFLRPADLRNMFRGPYGSPLVSRYFRMSHSENWRSPAMTVTTDGRVKLYA